MPDWIDPAVHLVPRPDRRRGEDRRTQRQGGRRACDMPSCTVSRAQAEASAWDAAHEAGSHDHPTKRSIH